MAKVRFDIRRFEKKYPLTKEIEEKLSLFGTPLESRTDTELEMEISANRPDLLSTEGFLRAFDAFMGKKTGLKEYTAKDTNKYTVQIDPSVKEVRPYTVCAVVKDLELTAETLQELIILQEKLHLTQGRNRKKAAIGIYPLDKITFPITFKAMTPESIQFTPLDAPKPINARMILQKHPKGKEFGALIESYTKFPVFIDAKQLVLSMPPIINSEEVGRVTPETTDLFIECSGYNKQTLNTILTIIVTTIAEMGGTLYSVEIQDGKAKERTPLLKPRRMPLSREAVQKRLGIEMDEKTVKKALERMGYDYQKGSVLVPAWRADVLHEVDVIEDAAIAYGYNNLVPTQSPITTIGQSSPESRVRTIIRELLTGLGMQELSSLHCITTAENEMWGEHALKLIAPKTEYTHLRPSLTILLMRALAQNKGAEYPQKLYELGTIFQGEPLTEKEHIGIALAPGNFTAMKQVVDYIIRELGLRSDMNEAIISHCIQGRAGTVSANETTIGHIGELTPHILNTHSLTLPISIAELDLTALTQLLYPK